MALITTIGSATANSYLSLAEAQTYLTSRDGFDLTTWDALSEASREFRLLVGVKLLDSLPFRGIRSCQTQAMSFPRMFRGDTLWPVNSEGNQSDSLVYRYATWAEVQAQAASLQARTSAIACTLPVIPEEVRQAQAEITFLLIHSHLMSADAGEERSRSVSYIMVDGMQISSVDDGLLRTGPYQVFSKELLKPSSVIFFLLKKYLNRVRWGII